MSSTSISLERVQFKCLKIIHRRSKFSSNSEIFKLPNYMSIEKRFDQLNIKYLKNCLSNKVDLIKEALDEYWNYSESRQLDRKTILFIYLF